MAVVFNHEKPLALVKGESLEANTAMRDYALLGEGRSLAKLQAHYLERQGQSGGKVGVENRPLAVSSKPSGIADGLHRAAIQGVPTTRLKTLEGWSARFGWQVRIQVWKDILDAEEEEKWRKRRLKLKEEEWEVGSEMLDLGRSGLVEGPKFIRTQRRYDQQNKREIVTLAIDIPGLTKLVESGSKLKRQAAEMPTETLRIDDWRTPVIEMLRKKQISPERVREDFGDDADELLRAAGLHPGKRSLQESAGEEEG